VLDPVATKTRDRKAALKLLRKLMRRYGSPAAVVTDKLKSYGAALRELGVDASCHQTSGRWINNRAENSHLPLRRRARAMLRFRQMRSLHKFAALHGSVQDPHGSSLSACFNRKRRLYSRSNVKEKRIAALAEWRQPLAA